LLLDIYTKERVFCKRIGDFGKTARDFGKTAAVFGKTRAGIFIPHAVLSVYLCVFGECNLIFWKTISKN